MVAKRMVEARRLRARRRRHVSRRAGATSATAIGDLPILVPGVGAQGGDARAAVAAGTTSDGRGLVVSSSRAVLYAGSGEDFADAARAAALAAREPLLLPQ